MFFISLPTILINITIIYTKKTIINLNRLLLLFWCILCLFCGQLFRSISINQIIFDTSNIIRSAIIIGWLSLFLYSLLLSYIFYLYHDHILSLQSNIKSNNDSNIRQTKLVNDLQERLKIMKQDLKESSDMYKVCKVSYQYYY
jgi:hypothetical protein